MTKPHPGDQNDPALDSGADSATDPAPRKRPPQFYDDEERIRVALAKMPPDTRIRLKRINDLTKKRETHGILSPDECTTEWIARRFGGGHYVVEVLERNDIGKEVVRDSATWDLPGPYLGVGRGLPGINEPPAGTPASAAPASGGAERMPTRELLDSAMASKFMDLLQRDARPGVNLEGIAAIVTRVGTLAMQVVLRLLDKQPDPALDDIRRELQAIKNRPGPGASALDDMLKGVGRIMQLRDTLDGGSGKESATDKLLNVLPGIVEAVTGRRAAPPPDDQPPENPTSMPQLPPGDTPPPAAGPGTPPWSAMLLQFREQLLFLAGSGWEPGYSAEMVQRLMPPQYLGLMTEFLQREDARDIVVQTIPELGAYEKWLPAFLAETKLAVLGDPNEPDAP